MRTIGNIDMEVIWGGWILGGGLGWVGVLVGSGWRRVETIDGGRRGREARNSFEWKW